MTLTPLLKELKEKAEKALVPVRNNRVDYDYIEFHKAADPETILFLIQAIEEMKEVLSEYADGQDYSGYAKEVLLKYFGEK